MAVSAESNNAMQTLLTMAGQQVSRADISATSEGLRIVSNYSVTLIFARGRTAELSGRRSPLRTISCFILTDVSATESL